MTKLTLTNHVQTNTTVLENEFIDRHMANANGEYVKVYLFLLRHLNDPAGVPKISEIADALDYTEKDVIRALNYWKNQGLLDYEVRPDAGGEVLPAAAHASDVSDIGQFRSRKEFKEILHVTEQYLQKTLSHTEMDAITYFYETLGMSADLIEYLIEYCVSRDKKSMRYIEAVALSWAKQGIRTVEKAKEVSTLYNKNCFAVMKAFGLSNRNPADAETGFIKKWTSSMGFSLDIILEACRRTIQAIHQPSFEYADSILTHWQEKGVHHLSDIQRVDQLRRDSKETKPEKPTRTSGNRFNNMTPRSYLYEDLEKQLLGR